MKKLLALTLALVFCFALASCSEQKADAQYVKMTIKDFGTVVIELRPDQAPITCDNFIKLVSDGFYDGLTFHRVIDDLLIQGGDPDGNGTGGPGYSIKGEFTANGVDNKLSHTRGAVSMARSSLPNSAGSQFFFVLRDYTYWDGSYAVFGYVVEGMDVLDKIGDVSCDSSDKPLTDVVIEKAELLESYKAE